MCVVGWRGMMPWWSPIISAAKAGLKLWKEAREDGLLAAELAPGRAEGWVAAMRAMCGEGEPEDAYKVGCVALSQIGGDNGVASLLQARW